MVFAPKTSNSNSENCSGKCLPNATPCLSYWQRTTRPFPLLYASREEKVVSSRLTISGINWKDVIILEARKAESGAGSQNIGHIRPGLDPTILNFPPDALRGFTAYSKTHGKEQALIIIANERLLL
ncbi:uncharacterized protein PADG_04212 [Paracoccidioides brasiliensis Pb18]|uniref:Uncharacterized protein n=1 Tax=Paracoccidioides brasiliensis (strain Pb18) TaxID=502780 RepID=C1GAC6_PARBD|nr:uncharacterized protein PADG_04212 [Paracoccidioides brasiliensis Pb18]EEH48128.2 hypothetical protein PADG_04212 [Paracoccidioides brasiliensis Pb18]